MLRGQAVSELRGHKSFTLVGVMKRPAASSYGRGRMKSCDSLEGLADAMRPWVTKPAFINYGSCKNLESLCGFLGFTLSSLRYIVSSSPSPHLPRKSKSKDIEKLQLYLEHFRRIQSVDRTWNFSHSTITAALQQLARVTWKYLVSFCQTKTPKPCTLNSKIAETL